MKLQIFRAVIHAGENKEFLFPTLRICRILFGEFDWKIGKNTIHVKCGDVILLNNLISRRIVNTTGTAEIEVFEFSPTLILNRKLLPKMFYSESPVTVSSDSRKLIGELLSVTAEAIKTVPSDSASRHLLQALFDLLENDAMNSAAEGKHSAMIFKAVDFIWEHYYEDISVPDVAKHLNVSKNHLEKQFKTMHGIGIGAYLRIIRVYKAMALLEEASDRSVLDIALSCGFNSSSGFYKAYKAIIGQNPRRKLAT